MQQFNKNPMQDSFLNSVKGFSSSPPMNNAFRFANQFPFNSQFKNYESQQFETVERKLDPLDFFEKNFDSITIKYNLRKDYNEDDTQVREYLIRLIDKLASINKVEFDLARLGYSAVMQAGGYLKSVTNRRIIIGNVEFTKKNIIYASEELGNKYTLRAIARYDKNAIARIALKYNYPGHLYARFKIENANFIAQQTPEQCIYLSVYCTDFQIENPDTPPIVREFLANRERIRGNLKKGKS